VPTVAIARAVMLENSKRRLALHFATSVRADNTLLCEFKYIWDNFVYNKCLFSFQCVCFRQHGVCVCVCVCVCVSTSVCFHFSVFVFASMAKCLFSFRHAVRHAATVC